MIEYKNVKKYFGDQLIIHDVSMTVNEGEFVVIIGPSGCGKTTTIKMLNRLVEASEGDILIDGVNNRKMDLIQLRTRIGYVIQQIGLFPNMTVLQNVEYALKFQPDLKKNARALAIDMLNQVGMSEHLNKKPHKLSGGQQQRVAIARTLALKPDVILFDEPMSALDAANRLTLRAEVKRIQKEFHITMIYITHDQEEAFTMSDRIMVMSEGHIEQIDTPSQLYHHPKNEYVEEFVVGHLKTKLSSLLDCMGLSL